MFYRLHSSEVLPRVSVARAPGPGGGGGSSCSGKPKGGPCARCASSSSPVGSAVCSYRLTSTDVSCFANPQHLAPQDEVRQTCERHLGARHAAERLLRCWGSGAGIILDETKASIKNLLVEFKALPASHQHRPLASRCCVFSRNTIPQTACRWPSARCAGYHDASMISCRAACVVSKPLLYSYRKQPDR